MGFLVGGEKKGEKIGEVSCCAGKRPENDQSVGQPEAALSSVKRNRRTRL